MQYILVLFLLVYTSSVQAFTLQPNLQHLSLDVHRFSGNREPMTPEIPLRSYKGAVQLNWDVGFGEYLAWDNKVYSSGTYSKFETVSWEYTLRVKTPWGIEPFLAHKSQHTMDQEQPIYEATGKPVKFPVRDSYGVRIIFYERTK